MLGVEYIVNVADFSVILYIHTQEIYMSTSGYEIRHALLSQLLTGQACELANGF